MKKQSGFTLVELAIVLMIIGLLIGGILKGQELIQNAKVLTVTRQMKSYSAAMITFQDSYGALPGDMTNAATRVPNCTTAPCNTAGDGNGRIFGLTEGANFWIHMSKANLISGVNEAAGTDAGQSSPRTALGGYFFAGDTPEVSNALSLWKDITIDEALLNAPLAARIDRKIDDGKPGTGDMQSFDLLIGCYASDAINYDEANSNTDCNSYIRL